METYSSLALKLAKRPTKKLANNTYAHRGKNGQADYISIRLHDTDILTYQPDGSVCVTSGGWKSVTTKDRINTYLPHAKLFQERGQWYWISAKPIAMFKDGDTFDASGTLMNPTPISEAKTSAKLRRRIVAYAKECAEALPLEPPGAGDCFYCRMVPVNSDIPLGDAFKDISHLELHMEETYIVPSLVYHALHEAHATDFVLACAFGQANDCPSLIDVARDHVKHAVMKYLRRRFALP